MFRTYREIAGKQNKFTQGLRKQGLVSVSVGSFFILVLVIANLIAFITFSDSPDIDMAAIGQPPALESLSAFLDNSNSIKNTAGTHLSSGFGSEMDDWDLDDSSDVKNKLKKEYAQTARKAVFLSHPVRNAVVHRNYKYQTKIKASIGIQSIHFTLGKCPSGMEIDAKRGELHWYPSSNQIGDHLVQINVSSANRVVGSQSFKLVVATKYHILGTDGVGRDVLEGLIRGSKAALLPGFVAVTIMVSFGVLFGALSGYYNGFADQVLSFFVHIIDSFPRLVLIFLVASIFNLNIYLIMLFVGLIYFPQIAAMIKEKIGQLKRQQYIEAAKELGLTDWVILSKHIIWYNCRPILFSQISFGFATAILIEVTLSYLGFGVQESNGSWGKMLNDAKSMVVNGEYWAIFFPSVMIVISLLGFSLIGDGLNKLFNIKNQNA